MSIKNKIKRRIKIIGLMIASAVLASCTTTGYWVGDDYYDGYYGTGVVDTDVYYVGNDYSDWNRAYGWGGWNGYYRTNGWGWGNYYRTRNGWGTYRAWDKNRTYYRAAYRRR